jgi:hypothetical protein
VAVDRLPLTRKILFVADLRGTLGPSINRPLTLTMLTMLAWSVRQGLCLRRVARRCAPGVPFAQGRYVRPARGSALRR